MRERRALRRTPPRVDAGFGKPETSDLATWVACAAPGSARVIAAEMIGAPVAELDAERTVIEVRA